MIVKAQAALIKFERAKTVCFSGHRNIAMGAELERLKGGLREEIDKAISDGYDTFLFGGAYGFDLLAAEAVIQRKRIISIEQPKYIRLICVIPFEEQASRWSEKDRELYFDTMPKCDEVITLSTRYHDKCYYDRNKFMVDRSERLICYHNGNARSGTGQTVRLAKEQQLEIINLFE